MGSKRTINGVIIDIKVLKDSIVFGAEAYDNGVTLVGIQQQTFHFVVCFTESYEAFWERKKRQKVENTEPAMTVLHYGVFVLSLPCYLVLPCAGAGHVYAAAARRALTTHKAPYFAFYGMLFVDVFVANPVYCVQLLRLYRRFRTPSCLDGTTTTTNQAVAESQFLSTHFQ